MHDASNPVDRKIRLVRIVATWRRISGKADGTSNRMVDPLLQTFRRLADPPGRHFCLPGATPAPEYVPSLPIDAGVCDTVGVASVKPLRTTSTEGAVLTEEAVETKKPWNVIVWNDPVTPMSVVVVIFKKIFGYSNNKCKQLMLEVHHEGRALVWSGARDRAESYCVKLQVSGLQSTIEQDN